MQPGSSVQKRVESGGESIHRSELARDKPENAAGHLPASVIVVDHREQARSYRAPWQPIIRGQLTTSSIAFWLESNVRYSTRSTKANGLLIR